MKYLIFLLFIAFISCSEPYKGVPEKYHALLDQAMNKAGENATELKKALDSVEGEEKEGMAFLISYMPASDLKTLSADFLVDNVKYAYLAKNRFPWGKTVPEEIFLNDVLPYASMDETRDNWRKDFYERFSKYVEGATNIEEAILAINKNVRDEVLVDYNTKRKKPNQSPYESIEINMASCSGLSVLLTDAFRAVGIPSRVAGTPSWHDNRGNHSWTEVWADGNWYFTEYYFPGQLNWAWFFADAGKATADSTRYAIFATSFKPTGNYFPMVWAKESRDVPGENVTERYVVQYADYASKIMNDGNHVSVKVAMWKNPKQKKNSDDRVAVNIDVFRGKDQMGGGRTSGPFRDMNDKLEFLLEKNHTYRFMYADADGKIKNVEVKVGDKPVNVDLYFE